MLYVFSCAVFGLLVAGREFEVDTLGLGVFTLGATFLFCVEFTLGAFVRGVDFGVAVLL